MGRHNRPTSIESLESRVLLSRLALISDFGTLQQSEADVMNLVKGWNTQVPLDAIITSGDNDQVNGDDYVNRVGNYYDEFIYGRGSATQRFLPVPGNHDWGYNSGRWDLVPYEAFFTIPDAAQGSTSGNERYYNYKIGDVEVFMLDSDPYEPDGTSSTSPQALWAKNAIEHSTAAWQIVSFHHAAYSSSSAHYSSTWMQWPFQAWGADLVVSGHNHVYERVNVDGLRFVTNGVGGWDGLNGFGTVVAGSEVRYNAQNGAILLEANSTSLSYQFINTDGQVIDTYSMTNVQLPNIAVTAADASEAGEVGGFTFTRSNVMAGDVTVGFTLGGSATSGADYESIGLSALIPEGVPSVTLPLAAFNDTLAEGDETVILTIMDDPAYVRLNSTATLTIADDDMQTATFQQGVDTNLMENWPNTSYATATSLTVDTDEPSGSSDWAQALVQFTDLIGPAVGQIPSGSTILSATLQLNVLNPGNTVNLYRMTTSWSDTSTWNSLGSGVQVGTETVGTADASFTPSAAGLYSMDVTGSLAAWLADPAGSLGWLLNPTGTDGVDIYSFESTSAPRLTVAFSPPVVTIPPTAAPDAYSVGEDTALVIDAAAGVLANDTDPDGDTLSAILVSGPSHGSLSLGSDGAFTYVPDADFFGSDSFAYKAYDGQAYSDVVMATITVAPINDAPVAAGDAYSMTQDTVLSIAAPGVLGNDGDVDGDVLSARVMAGPANGTISFTADGAFTYTPALGFTGTDSFSYVVNDGLADSSEATVAITVNRVNAAPVANDDDYSTTEDTAIIEMSFAANDTDADLDPLAVKDIVGPGNGTLTLNVDGTFTYTPNADFYGTDTFTYSVTDGLLDSNWATVAISVNPVNDAPVAVDDAVATDEDVALVFSFLGNDHDIDGDPLGVSGITGPSNGILALNADETYTYTPNPDFSGADSFTYQAYDGSSLSDVATVTITISPVNDAPLAGSDEFSTDEDTPLVTIAPGVLGNDVDVDGDALVPVVVSGPGHGALMLNADGSFTYTPSSNFNGSDSFSYQVTDGSDISNVATVNLTVLAVNDGPVAADDSATVVEGQTLNGASVLANDADVEGDAITAMLAAPPAHGSLTLNQDGTYAYVPDAGYSGSDQFTYQAVDALGAQSVPATVAITIAPLSHDDYAVSEATTFGTVSGGLAAAVGDNDTYETIQEARYAVNKKARLSHQWEFDVSGGGRVEFYLQAHNNSGIEEFIFAYSLDQTIWTSMLTVVKGSDDDTYQTFALPDATAGRVWVRVTDSNPDGQDRVADTVFIDDMFIRSYGTTALPSVSILASDANAAEADADPGKFTITRSGDTGADLAVDYSIGGTADNGIDYEAVTGRIIIPAGSASVSFSINPIDDPDAEGDESIVIGLLSSSAYIVDTGIATVTISDNDVVITLPAAPTELSAVAASSSQIDLSWTDNAANEDGFLIERSTDGLSFAYLADVGANTTSYSDAGLLPSTTYTYRVKAYNAEGSSSDSNSAAATTQAAADTPAAPTNLTGTAVQKTKAKLTWLDNADDETGFNVYSSIDGVNWTLLATVAPRSGTGATAQYTSGPLSKGTWHFRVSAFNDSGESAFSEIVTVTI